MRQHVHAFVLVGCHVASTRGRRMRRACRGHRALARSRRPFRFGVAAFSRGVGQATSQQVSQSAPASRKTGDETIARHPVPATCRIGWLSRVMAHPRLVWGSSGPSTPFSGGRMQGVDAGDPGLRRDRQTPVRGGRLEARVTVRIAAGQKDSMYLSRRDIPGQPACGTPTHLHSRVLRRLPHTARMNPMRLLDRIQP